MSITHSERNIWNGPTVTAAISRKKRKPVLEGNGCTWPLRSPDLTVCDFFLWGFVKDNVYVPQLPKTLPELRDSASTQQSGTAHKTCLRGFGGNGSIAWTSAMSHVGRTSNAFKVTMKLQTFLFQMVVTSCISVQCLWKYGFAKSSDNLYAPCIMTRPWDDQARTRGSIQARAEIIFLSTGSTGALLPGVKGAGAWNWSHLQVLRR